MTITSQIHEVTNNSSYNPPSNRTFIAKFPENGKMIIQKSLVDKGTSIAVRQKTFDWWGEISLTASDSGTEAWKVSGGPGNLIATPSNFTYKLLARYTTLAGGMEVNLIHILNE